MIRRRLVLLMDDDFVQIGRRLAGALLGGERLDAVERRIVFEALARGVLLHAPAVRKALWDSRVRTLLAMSRVTQHDVDTRLVFLAAMSRRTAFQAEPRKVFSGAGPRVVACEATRTYVAIEVPPRRVTL